MARGVGRAALQPGLRRPLLAPDHENREPAQRRTSPRGAGGRAPAAAMGGRHDRASVGTDHRRDGPDNNASRRLTTELLKLTDAEASRGIEERDRYLGSHPGPPVRRRPQPDYPLLGSSSSRYAGTDDDEAPPKRLGHDKKSLSRSCLGFCRSTSQRREARYKPRNPTYQSRTCRRIDV